MAIVRWKPGYPATSLQDSIEKFFNTSLLGHWEDEFLSKAWNPAVNVAETEAEFVVTAELPGLEKDDVEVEVNENVLTIKGERKEEKEEEGKTFHRIERRYGSFQRSFYLPDNADVEGIKASHKKGVLELKIPKVIEEKKEPQRINIETD